MDSYWTEKVGGRDGMGKGWGGMMSLFAGHLVGSHELG